MFQIATLTTGPCPCGHHLAVVYEQTTLIELVPGVYQVITLIAEGRLLDDQLVILDVQTYADLVFDEMSVWEDGLDECEDEDDWRQVG